MAISAKKRVEVLREGLEELASQRYLEEIFHHITGAIRGFLPYKSYAIVLIGEDGDPKVKASRGLSYTYIKELHRQGAHPAFEAMKNEESSMLITPGHKLFGKVIFEHQYKALAMVPLVVSEEMVGLLFVDSDEPEAFDESTMEFLEELALLASVAIDFFACKDAVTESVNRDGVTGLYNYKHFHEILFREILRSKETGRTFSLVLFAIAGLKEYNASFGHVEGDRLLREIGRFISQRMRSFDIEARYGGSKIVVLMPETEKEEAIRRTEEILKACEEEPWSQKEPAITLKAGIASFPVDTDDEKVLLNYLEQATFEATRKEGNALIVWPL